MKHPLIINSHGKISDRRPKVRPKVRPSAPYHGIARRAIEDSYINYDKKIDISAAITRK